MQTKLNNCVLNPCEVNMALGERRCLWSFLVWPSWFDSESLCSAFQRASLVILSHIQSHLPYDSWNDIWTHAHLTTHTHADISVETHFLPRIKWELELDCWGPTASWCLLPTSPNPSTFAGPLYLAMDFRQCMSLLPIYVPYSVCGPCPLCNALPTFWNALLLLPKFQPVPCVTTSNRKVILSTYWSLGEIQSWLGILKSCLCHSN